MKITDKNQMANLLKTPFIDRSLHPAFFSHVSNSKEVSILYGPRQVGKSQEIYKCILVLTEKPNLDIFYYNLDVVPDEFESPDAFLATIFSQKNHPDRPTCIFLDEAQRLENVGLFVKYIYDQNKNIEFVLTGSASLDIKAKIKEPLTGRKQEFFLAPLSLREIVSYRGIKTDNITSGFPLLIKTLGDYLLFGGYPEVVTLDTKPQKIAKITEIANSYTLKDISGFFSFANPRTIQLVARFLAENIGNLLSKENISKIGGIPKYQTEKALDALEKSFIIKLIPPFAKSPSKELIHRPKIFFQDLGIRNALLNKLDRTFISADIGQLFENAVALELGEIFGPESIRFWRTTNQTEVDFVVLNKNGSAAAFEAKYNWEKPDKLPKNLQSLKHQYSALIKKTAVISQNNFWKLFKEVSA